jgi:hypothetical protein
MERFAGSQRRTLAFTVAAWHRGGRQLSQGGRHTSQRRRSSGSGPGAGIMTPLSCSATDSVQGSAAVHRTISRYRARSLCPAAAVAWRTSLTIAPGVSV